MLDKVSSSELSLSYDYSMNNFCDITIISKVIYLCGTVYFTKYINLTIYFLTAYHIKTGFSWLMFVING